MSQPLLSIAIPTYNRADLLDLCLGRIISQLDAGSPDIELLVSNNASTDHTKQIIEKYQQKFSQLRYSENEKNRGPDFNIAKCFELATAKYVWVFSDDDIVLPNAIAHIMLILVQNDISVLFLEPNFYQQSVHEFVPPRGPLAYQVYDNPGEIVADRHFWITYISGVITNKNLVRDASTLYQYQNSNLIQLGWVLPALFKGKPSIKVATPLILGRGLETLDFKLFQVYGISYPRVLDGLAKQEAIPLPIKNLLMQLIIKDYFHHYIKPDTVYTHGERPFRILSKSYWRETGFWTTLLPLFVRRDTVRLTRRIKQPVHQAIRKLLAASYGKLASVHRSVQADAMVNRLKAFGRYSQLPEQYRIINPQHLEIGRGFYALAPFAVEARTNYQGDTFVPEVVIGHNVRFGADCRLDCIKSIRIGDWVVIGNRVLMKDNEVDEEPLTLLTIPPANRRLSTRGAVKIEDNVLIEDDVRIMSGVTIGQNAIIRAGAVVSKSVPANATVAGNPAQVIEKFDLINQFKT